MLHVLERDGLVDRDVRRRATPRAPRTRSTVARRVDARARRARRAASRREDDRRRRRGASAGAKRAMALWSMGANQSTVGTLKNRALINLCLATGNIGRPGHRAAVADRPAERDGRARDRRARAPAARLPQRSTDAEDRAEMRPLLGLPPSAGIAPEPGLAATELVEALEDGPGQGGLDRRHQPGRLAARRRRASPPRCGAPSSSIVPGRLPPDRDRRARARAAARRAVAGEGRDDDELRAARVASCSAALDPPGEALPDWEIFARVGRALGHREAFAWRSAAAGLRRVRAPRPRAGCATRPGISHARLRRDGPLQWPCPRAADGEDHDGTERLYSVAALPDARRPRAARRRRRTPRPPTRRDADFPLVLTTGRVAQPVAHDDPHRQVADAARRRAASRSSSCTRTTPSAPASSDGERVRVRSRRGRGDAARAGDATRVPAGRRVRAVPLGRAAPRAGRGRAQRA